jgi:hypothetical protein
MHRAMTVLAGSALLVAIAIVPARADSLEARKMHAHEEADLATQLDLTNRACGGSLQAKIDWSTFDPAEALKKGVVAWCRAGLDAIEDLCGDDMGKQAVKEKVKMLTCAGAAEPSATLSQDGNLIFKFSLTPNQNKLLVRGYLEKNL